MIDYKRHIYHADILGGKKEFNEYIDAIHKLAPWLNKKFETQNRSKFYR